MAAPRSLYGRTRLINLRLVIVVFQFDQQVPFVHLLIVTRRARLEQCRQPWCLVA